LTARQLTNLPIFEFSYPDLLEAVGDKLMFSFGRSLENALGTVKMLKATGLLVDSDNS